VPASLSHVSQPRTSPEPDSPATLVVVVAHVPFGTRDVGYAGALEMWSATAARGPSWLARLTTSAPRAGRRLLPTMQTRPTRQRKGQDSARRRFRPLTLASLGFRDSRARPSRVSGERAEPVFWLCGWAAAHADRADADDGLEHPHTDVGRERLLVHLRAPPCPRAARTC